MPTSERLLATGTSRGHWLIGQLGRELRDARLAAGLSQARIGSASGLSQQTISRYELGQHPYPDLLQAARVATVLGLELRVQTYPTGGQLRDAAHFRLINRFLARVPPTISHRLEAPVQRGDLRAWDVLLSVDGTQFGVIAETRIRDLQALLRREHRKQLDGGVDRLILLVAETRHNRETLASTGSLMQAEFPLRTRAVMAAFRSGRAPAGNGIVLL